MSYRDIIVLGTSAGGVEALRKVAGGLSEGFNGSLFVVMHAGTDSPSLLASILTKSGPLPAAYVKDGQAIEPGRIYIAPPDYHLLLEKGKMRLSRGPKENLFRPAIDPLFRSAAQIYGARVIGVVLTGGLDDGTSGLQAVKQMSGVTIVQDPKEAYAPSMPANALRHVSIDYCLPVSEIGFLLTRLTSSAFEEKEELTVPADLKAEVAIATGDNAIDAGVELLGKPSPYACPECHGVLLRLNEGKPERFRCHVGHAYSTASLVADITKKVDETLWTATRALDEAMLLMGHLAKHLDELPDVQTSQAFLEQAGNLRLASDKVREAIVSCEPVGLRAVSATDEFPD
jgi:two-component system chemotaxis response regulator CheB